MKKVINSPKAPKAIGPYSQAIEVNGMIYISGQLPVDVNTGKFAEGGIQEQTISNRLKYKITRHFFNHSVETPERKRSKLKSYVRNIE